MLLSTPAPAPAGSEVGLAPGRAGADPGPGREWVVPRWRWRWQAGPGLGMAGGAPLLAETSAVRPRRP